MHTYNRLTHTLQTIYEGPYVGNYYSMGQHTGGCLYRFKSSLFTNLSLTLQKGEEGATVKNPLFIK